jgi:hypothetical protein
MKTTTLQRQQAVSSQAAGIKGCFSQIRDFAIKGAITLAWRQIAGY